jgi:chromosome segregation ATPase
MDFVKKKNEELEKDCDSLKSKIALLEKELTTANGERLMLAKEVNVNRELFHVEVEKLKDSLSLKSANLLLFQEKFEAAEEKLNLSQIEMLTLRDANSMLLEMNTSLKADADLCRVEIDDLSIAFASIKTEHEAVSLNLIKTSERLKVEEGIKSQLKLKIDRLEEASNVTETQMTMLSEKNSEVFFFLNFLIQRSFELNF